MNRYFVTYYPYSYDISRIYHVIGETEKYYRVQNTSSKTIELVNKESHYIRGSDIKLTELPEQEIRRKLGRQKTINLCEKTKWKEMTDEQLERIRKILEER